jgi:hypothetical protein
MTLLEMSREKALDIVFDTRPYLPNDWYVFMEAGGDETPEGFVVGEPYCGRDREYIRASLLELHSQLYNMAECAIQKVCDLASRHAPSGNHIFINAGDNHEIR